MTDTTAKPTPLLVLDVVGLTPRLLEHMPRLRAVAEQGWQAELGTILPAVTCSAQATFTTGTLPKDHGIVGNGWYFRDLGEVLLWRQHNKLVQGENVWVTARKAHPALVTDDLDELGPRRGDGVGQPALVDEHGDLARVGEGLAVERPVGRDP